jgi:hypothetical protein
MQSSHVLRLVKGSAGANAALPPPNLTHAPFERRSSSDAKIRPFPAPVGNISSSALEKFEPLHNGLLGSARIHMEISCPDTRLALSRAMPWLKKAEQGDLELADSLSAAYAKLIKDAVAEMRTNAIFLPGISGSIVERKFLELSWGVLERGLGAGFGHNNYGLLSESITSMCWDTFTGSMLIYDMGRAMGFPMRVVLFPRHAAAATELFFHVPGDVLGEVENIPAYSKCNYGIFHEPEKIHSLSYLYLALMQQNIGEYEAAVPNIRASLAINSDNADAHFVDGLIKSSLGDKKGSVAAYSRAILGDNSFDEAYYNRGIIRFELGDVAGALQDCAIAAGLRPDDTIIQESLGIMYSVAGKGAEAKKCFSACRGSAPGRHLALVENERQ